MINLFFVGFFFSFSVIFFRDSLLITVVLIVNTIIVQGMMSCNAETPAWVNQTTAYMGSNRVGHLFLTKPLVSTVPTIQQLLSSYGLSKYFHFIAEIWCTA